ncbi:MAG: hypothetical protein ACR650_00135 [Methylocystis sp.]
MKDRTPVKLTVSVERVCKGGLLGIARAEIEVDALLLVLNGIEARRGFDGRLEIDTPGVAHGSAILPAVELPPDLEAAIGREVAALLR